MDKETLIEAMTNELNRVYGHWSHEFENEEVIQVMANAVLSLLQWKDVADGLPEVEGTYVVKLLSDILGLGVLLGVIGKTCIEHISVSTKN